MLLYKDTPNGKEYMTTHGFTADKSQAHDFNDEEARQKMNEYPFLQKEQAESKMPWPPEVTEWKKKNHFDGDFEPCAYDVERERREMEKQERHDYIDRHREVRK